jgi:hypothetical protein
MVNENHYFLTFISSFIPHYNASSYHVLPRLYTLHKFCNAISDAFRLWLPLIGFEGVTVDIDSFDWK